MHRKLSNTINPASLLAMVALFVALGGVSYAATKIGTKDIKNGAVTAKKLKRNAVTTAKIRTDAVTGAKVKEATLGQVPSAAKAGHAESATAADKAAVAADSEQLGGTAAVHFGSGIVGAAVTAPPAIALAPSAAVGAPIGEGEFQMPVPVPLQLRNLFVKVDGDVSRPFVASLRNPGGQSLACGGSAACAIPGPVAFKPGDVIELAVTVLPGPGVFAGATYQVGYRITP